jgi:hypothetical protein
LIIDKGIKDLYEMKLIHVQANELLRIMCKEVSISNDEHMRDGKVLDAIFYAIKNGIFKFVCEIAKESRQVLVYSNNDDERFSSTLSAAIFHRQAKIFSFIYGLDVNNLVLYSSDNKGNNILHMAGKLPPSTLVNRTAGAAFQMQREVQWYKVCPSLYISLIHFHALYHKRIN